MLESGAPLSSFLEEVLYKSLNELMKKNALLFCTCIRNVSRYMLDVLHWLPLQQRISYRIISLIWGSLLGLAPAYLRDLCHTTMGIPGRPSLRSTQQGLLLVPFAHTASSSSFRLLKYTKDRTPAVTAATGVLVTYKQECKSKAYTIMFRSLAFDTYLIGSAKVKSSCSRCSCRLAHKQGLMFP